MKSKTKIMMALAAVFMMIAVTGAVMTSDNSDAKTSAGNACRIGSVEYGTIEEALTAATTGNTIELLRNISATGEIKISKNLTIDGKDKIISSEQYKFFVVNDNINFTLKNVTLNTSNLDNRAINIAPDNTTTSNNVIVLEEVNINFPGGNNSNRAIAVGNGVNTGSITVKECKFLCGDETYQNNNWGANSRGISTWISKNMTIDIINSEIKGFKYAVCDWGKNNTDGGNNTINITGSTIHGWACLSIGMNNGIYNITDSTLQGNSKTDGPSDDYGTIVHDLPGGSNDTVVNLKNSVIYANDIVESQNAWQYVIDFRAPGVVDAKDTTFKRNSQTEMPQGMFSNTLKNYAGSTFTNCSVVNEENEPLDVPIIYWNIKNGLDGNTYTNTEDMTIPEGVLIEVPKGYTLINQGTIINNGTISIEGTVTNNGTINYNVNDNEKLASVDELFKIITGTGTFVVNIQEGTYTITPPSGNNTAALYFTEGTNNLTINGNGSTITTSESSQITDSSFIGILGLRSNKIAINDLILDGANKTVKRGLNVNGSGSSNNNIELQNVECKNLTVGIICNASYINAVNLKTSGDAWGGVNVDVTASVNTQDSSFTIDSESKLDDAVQIWKDKDSYTGGTVTRSITITANGYTPYKYDAQTIYLKDGILTKNLTLEKNLTIGSGNSLTIADGVTLTISGNGTITNNGIITNNGTIECNTDFAIPEGATFTMNKKGAVLNIAEGMTFNGKLSTEIDGKINTLSGNFKAGANGVTIVAGSLEISGTFSKKEDSSTGTITVSGSDVKISGTMDKNTTLVIDKVDDTTKSKVTFENFNAPEGSTVTKNPEAVDTVYKGEVNIASDPYKVTISNPKTYYNGEFKLNGVTLNVNNGYTAGVGGIRPLDGNQTVNGIEYVSTLSATNAGNYYVVYEYDIWKENVQSKGMVVLEWTIEQKAVDIAGVNSTKVYNGSKSYDNDGMNLTGVIDGDAGSVSVVGNYNSENVIGADKITFTLSGDKSSNYYIRSVNSNGGTDTAPDNMISGTITVATITVTPDADQSKTYGTEDSSFTSKYAGLKNNETPEFDGALSRKSGDAVGNYDILIGTLELKNGTGFIASNYSLELNSTPVMFKIEKATLDTPGELKWDGFTAKWHTVNPIKSDTVSYTVSLYENGSTTAAKTYSGITGTSQSFEDDMKATGLYTFTVTAVTNDTANINNSNVETSSAGQQVYTVTFDSGGHGDVPATQYIIENQNVTMPSALSKAGYTFGGWKVGTTETILNADANHKVVANVTITAKWSLDVPAVAITNNISKNYNGSPETITVTPSHAAGSGITYVYSWTKNDVNYSHTSGTLDVTNFADSGTYKVTVTANDGTLTSAGTEESITVTISKATLSTPTNLTWDGFTAKWHTVNPIKSGTDTVSYTVSLYENGSTTAAKTYSDIAGTSQSFTNDIKATGSYTFTVKAITNDITHANINDGTASQASGGQEVYTVTFNSNGYGTAPAAQYVISGSTATTGGTLTQTGYTHDAKWYTEAACTNEFNFSTTVTADKTLYAKWTINEPKINTQPGAISVTYNGNNHTLSVSASSGGAGSLTYQWYKGSSPINDATSATYSVKSVGDNGSYYVIVTASDGALTSSVDSNAVYVEISKATINVNSMSAVTTGENVYTFGDIVNGVTPTGGTVEKLGLKFTTSDGAAKSYTISSSESAGDNAKVELMNGTGGVADNYTISIVLNAKFTITSDWTITFKESDGSEYSESQRINTESTSTKSAMLPFAKNDKITVNGDTYYFRGWTDVVPADVTGIVKYQPLTYITVSTDMTLYAVYEKAAASPGTVKVTFKQQLDSDNATEIGTMTVQKNSAVYLQNMSIEGYTFVGWYVEENGAGKIGSYNVGGEDVTLTAKFTKIEESAYHTVTLTETSGVTYVIDGEKVFGSVNLPDGTYNINVIVAPGYEGTPDIKVGGESITGGTFTVNNNNLEITVTGITKVDVPTYTVTLKNGETDVEATFTGVSGEKFMLPYCAPEEGKYFKGWYTATTDGNLVGEFGEYYTIIEGTDLYAQFGDIDKPVSVTFEYGESETIVLSVQKDSVIVLPSASKGGNTFDGWMVGSTVGKAGEFYMVTAEVTLVAKFTEIPAESSIVTIGAGFFEDADAARLAMLGLGSQYYGGVDNNTMFIVYNQYGYSDKTITGKVYFNGAEIFTETLSDVDGVRTWLFSDFNNNFEFKTGTYTIKIFVDENAIITTKEVYVSITEFEYTVTLDNGFGVISQITVVKGTEYKLPDVNAPLGYTFNGWFVNGKGTEVESSVISADVTFVANYTKTSNTFGVTYANATNGSIIGSAEVVKGNMGIFTATPAEGYYVSGVTVSDGSYVKLSDNSYMFTSKDGSNVTITVTFATIPDSKELGIGIWNVQNNNVGGFKVTLKTEDGGYIPASGKLWVYMTYTYTATVEGANTVVFASEKVPMDATFTNHTEYSGYKYSSDLGDDSDVPGLKLVSGYAGFTINVGSVDETIITETIRALDVVKAA